MPSEADIKTAAYRRGVSPALFPSVEQEEFAAHVRRLLNPEFCGIRQNLEIGEIGQRYCRWPQDEITIGIAEVISSLGRDKMLGACQAACDDIAAHIEVSFRFVDDTSGADIAIHVSPLGGPGGVLAQCTLVPCGIRRGQFQGTLEADQFENWVWADTPSGLGIDWQRVFGHELIHGLGLPHVTTPRSLMNPTYSTTIRTVQSGDVDALVQLGYRRRTKPVEPKPTEKKVTELFRFPTDKGSFVASWEELA